MNRLVKQANVYRNMEKGMFHNRLLEVMTLHSRLIALVIVPVAFSCAEKRELAALIGGDKSKLWYVNLDPRSKIRRCFYFNRDGTWKMLVRDLQGNLSKYDHLWPGCWILKGDSVISLGETEYKIHEVNPSLLILYVDLTKITLQLVEPMNSSTCR